MVVPFAPKTGEICTVQIILQPIPFKSDRLLGATKQQIPHEKLFGMTG
jgi:hypothetical protein